MTLFEIIYLVFLLVVMGFELLLIIACILALCVPPDGPKYKGTGK